MNPEDKLADFRSQELFVGIDVHKKSWTVTIRLENLELKTFSMNPSSEAMLST